MGDVYGMLMEVYESCCGAEMEGLCAVVVVG